MFRDDRNVPYWEPLLVQDITQLVSSMDRESF